MRELHFSLDVVSCSTNHGSSVTESCSSYTFPLTHIPLSDLPPNNGNCATELERVGVNRHL